jgi:hypothetical protein
VAVEGVTDVMKGGAESTALLPSCALTVIDTGVENVDRASVVVLKIVLAGTSTTLDLAVDRGESARDADRPLAAEGAASDDRGGWDAEPVVVRLVNEPAAA